MPELLSTQLRRHAVECLYYWAHPANVRSIVQNGVLSYNLVHDSDLRHESLAAPGVQIRRDRMLAISGLSLHSYVPLYLVRRSPMLWAIRNQPRVCIRMDLRVADKPGTLFTDGNAASDATRIFSDVRFINEVPWEVLHRRRWTGSQVQDGTRRRCAEVLIPYAIEIEYVLDIVCHPLVEIDLPLGHRHLRENKPNFLEP
jgi:hypothetical protein